MARWLPLLLTTTLGLGACGGERPAAVEPTSAATVAPSGPPPAAAPPAAVQPRHLVAGPNVTVMPDGSAELRPPVGDVAMLRRMPDGTFKRLCGAPDADMRDMIQAKMRARRGAK